MLAAAALLASGCGADGSTGPPLPTVAATATVHTVCLAVTATFADVDGAPLVPPIGDTVASILEENGLEVRAVGEACDARLEFALTFTPVGAEYSTTGIGGGRTCYAGAEASGEVTLALNAAEALTKPLAMRDEPPHGITGCPGPDEAPFDAVWRRPVLEALGEWWGLPALVTAMQSDDALVAGAAGGVMADMGIGASPAVPFLMEMLAAADPAAPAEGKGGDFALAAHVIVQISPEAATQAMPRLAIALEEGERSTRLAVIRSLGETASPVPASAVAALVAALQGDEDPYLRAEAANMLGRLGPEAAEAVPALVAALEDRGGVTGSSIDTVAQAAALALGAIGDTSALQALLADLERGGREALAAINALEAMGTAAAAAVPALVEALEGEHWASASLALQAITGQYDTGEGETYLRWWHSLECAATIPPTEATVGSTDGDVQVSVEEASFIPDSFADARPCGPPEWPCRARPDVVAEGQFFAVRYRLANETGDGYELPAGCSRAEPRGRCSGDGWWITDGKASWPATWSDVWQAWAAAEGEATASRAEAGESLTSWAVFDVPEDFSPVAIAWPLENGQQVCLAWP